MSEIVDIYDTYHNKTGLTCERNEVPADTFRMGAVICFITKQGELLLQKRAGTRVFSGKWDFSAGGGALTGETPAENIKREVYEELGIEINMDNAMLFDVVENGNWIVNYYIQECDKSILEKIKPNEEVSEVKFVDAIMFMQILLNGDFRSDYDCMMAQKLLSKMEFLRERSLSHE